MRTTTTPTAYSYLRFSSPGQATGDSIRRQTESTAEWCRRNKVTLDTTVKMTDAGVSAYKGKHRAATNADTHAMANFLALVKSGRIQEGSYLILESLDRLTREDIIPAVNLFTSILLAGIKIVQLHPNEHVYTSTADMTHVMLALVELSRGNSESKMKSERVGAAWRKKIKDAGTRPISKHTPGWIDNINGKLVLNAERAKIVRRIYAMAIDGHGTVLTARTLNAENVPVMGRAIMKGRPIRWGAPSIRHILVMRAAMGEYVPYASDGKRTPGEPVPNYYPPAVDEATWHAAQASITTRAAVGRGRKGKHVNILAGLIKDADGNAMTYSHRNRPAATVTSTAAVHGAGKWISFPSDALDQAILAGLTEVPLEDVTGEDDDVTKTVKRMGGEIAETEALIRAWTARMNDVNIVDTVAAKLGELNAKLRKQVEERTAARRKAANPVAGTLGEIKTLADLMAADGGDEMKLKIRSAIRRVVSSINLMILPGKGGRYATRYAAAHVQFVGSERSRTYLIWWSIKEGLTWVAIPQIAHGKDIDIRTAEGADVATKILKAGPEKLIKIMKGLKIKWAADLPEEKRRRS